MSVSASQYSTDAPKREALYDPMVRMAVFALGGEVRRVADAQGLSIVSYLTAKPETDTTGWRLDPETGEVTTPRVTFWQGGSLAKATRNKAVQWERKPGKRGKVDPTFSKAARRRLMRVFGMLHRPQRNDAPLFVTLTAPGKAALWEQTSPKDWKRFLDTWWKRVKRVWPNAAAIWRLEPQKRGAPHFHLVIWGVWEGGIPRSEPHKRRWRAVTEWVSRSWWDVWGSNDPDHLKAGTSCEVVANWRRLMYYVSKYMAKVGVAWPSVYETVGRLWGMLGRAALPWADTSTHQITDTQAVKVIRLMRKFAGLQGQRFDTLTVFCDASFWHSKLSGVLL